MKKLDLFKFKKKVDSGSPFIVKFKRDSCPVCVELEPDYIEVSKRFPNLEFFNVDTEEEDELSDLFINDGVPTLYYIHGKDFRELDYPQKGFDKESLTKEILKHINKK